MKMMNGWVAAVIAVVACLGLPACQSDSGEPAGRRGKESPQADPAAKENSSPALPDSSLYQVDSRWISDRGDTLRLADLRGKPRVLTMFFGNCQSSCPMAMASLKKMQSELPQGWAEKAGFVLVTLDPRRDDAGALADYRRKLSLDDSGWSLLRGGPEDTRELAMLVGVAYAEAKSNGGMEHNSVFVLLDKDGRVLRRQEGTSETRDLVKALRQEMKKAGD